MTFCNYSVRFGVRFVSLLSAPRNFPTRWLQHLERFPRHAWGGPSCGTLACASPRRQLRSKWDSPKSDRFLPLYSFLSRPLGLFYFVLVWILECTCLGLQKHRPVSLLAAVLHLWVGSCRKGRICSAGSSSAGAVCASPCVEVVFSVFTERCLVSSIEIPSV